jgi:hypothetical protein
MALVHRFASILRSLVHRNRTEQDLHDELQAFVDMAAADKVRDGAPTGRAPSWRCGADERTYSSRSSRRLARRGWTRHSICFRMFAKHPGFAFVVVLTVAVVRGANTAIFSLIDALMLRWLPVQNPQELVRLKFTSSDAKSPTTGPLPDALTVSEHLRRIDPGRTPCGQPAGTSSNSRQHRGGADQPDRIARIEPVEQACHEPHQVANGDQQQSRVRSQRPSNRTRLAPPSADGRV